MPVPTLDSITPTVGPTSGSVLVELVGTNFRLPDTPDATGPVPTPSYSTIQVEFGGTVAPYAAAYSETLAVAELPQLDPGAALDVVLRNLDNDGDPIAGEAVTLPAAFTPQRPDLSLISHPEHVTRQLTLMLRRNVIEEVVHTWHTDWTDSADDSLRVTRIARTPALILNGPRGSFGDRLERGRERTRTRDGSLVKIARPMLGIDLEFDLGAVTDHTGEALRLYNLVAGCFHRNPWVVCKADPNDESSAEVRYEIDVITPFSSATRPSGSNVRDFAGAIRVRGVPIGNIPGVADDLVTRRAYVLPTAPTIGIQSGLE